MGGPPASPPGAGGLRFGVLVSPPLTYGSVVEAAERAEELGYDAFYIPDHFNEVISPVPALAAAASATSLRIGAYMLANDLRHPAMTARDFAALDELSGGRAELGLGAGWWPPDYRALGMEMDRPSDRISRLKEAVSLIRACWTQEQVDHEGRWYRTRLTPMVRPVQKPHPPIIVGGGGPKLLAAAAEAADVVSITAPLRSGRREDLPAEAARAEYGELARKARSVREASKRTAALDMLFFRVAVGERSERVVEAVAAEHGVDPERVRRSPFFQVGTPEEAADGVERLADCGFGSFAVRAVDMEAGARVKALLEDRRRRTAPDDVLAAFDQTQSED